MLLSEEWRNIPGYEGRYQASSLGQIRSCGMGRNGRSGKVLKPTLNGPARRQYPRVRLYANGTPTDVFVHVLVMLAFEGPPPQGHEIDHVDDDPRNPSYSNLEYVTRPEQQRRVYRRDKSRVASSGPGEANHNARLTWTQVNDIRARASDGVSQRTIAGQFGISQSRVSRIVAGVAWRSSCQS